jgi:hypothetical protein
MKILKRNCTLILMTVIFSNNSFSQTENVRFKKHILFSEFEQYISEGVAVGDVNKDGKPDVLAGTFWFEAPTWKRHEIDVPEVHSIGGYGNSFLNYCMDVNGDGWIDFIRIGFPSKEAWWYENPKNKPGHWKRHLLYHSVGNESPSLVDIDGDGKLDLLCNDPINKKVVWISPPRKKRDTLWTTHIISSDTLIGTSLFTHGLGYGDVNGDGYKDVIIKDGWWEGSKHPKRENWTFHPASLGEECAQMYSMDVDGDGDSDIISSSVHNYGIWWHEQVRNGDSVRWKQHLIYKGFSQSHSLLLKDINGDGHPDLITGTRFWAHNGNDPGAKEPAVLYWFEYKPGQNPLWIPHLIDNDSGVGLNFVSADMNGDGLPDIIISNKKGVFIFEQIKQFKKK